MLRPHLETTGDVAKNVGTDIGIGKRATTVGTPDKGLLSLARGQVPTNATCHDHPFRNLGLGVGIALVELSDLVTRTALPRAP